jgi:hypothetical protein
MNLLYKTRKDVVTISTTIKIPVTNLLYKSRKVVVAILTTIKKYRDEFAI